MQNISGKWIRVGAVTLALGMISSTSWAKWMAPTQMPVARLLKNVQAYVKTHPKDAHGYYTLGRINSAAFAQDTETIGVYTFGPLPEVPAHSSLIPPPRNRTKPLSARTLTYLSDALRNYQQATVLSSADGLTWLGLGFQCEEALPFPKAIVQASVALNDRSLDAEKLRQRGLLAYRKAYALTVKKDSSETVGPANPVSVEAAQGILRLQANRSLSSEDQKEVAEMRQRITTFQNQPRMVTPILISFERQASLTDLLAPEKHVGFDLAGDGLGRKWSWVKPTTGILVWDPQHTGKITSGLQLFGSVTWWLFWKDGYEPLAALDNNRNGWLEDKELQGIAVWFDRNGNGISDKGEVVSLSALSIKRIAAHAAKVDDGVPVNQEGIQLRDGSSLKTFDWMPSSIK